MYEALKQDPYLYLLLF